MVRTGGRPHVNIRYPWWWLGGDGAMMTRGSGDKWMTTNSEKQAPIFLAKVVISSLEMSALIRAKDK
jgi:hypothetical protein